MNTKGPPQNCQSRLSTSALIIMVNTQLSSTNRGRRRGRDRMVVGFTTTYAISAYHH